MALSLLAVLGPPAAFGDSVVATSPSPMNVSAYGVRVVWGELGEGGWQLKTLENGAPTDLPVPRFRGEFQVGPAEDGSSALVHSRCGHTPEGGVTDCDVFRYDFDSQIETPVRSINTAGAVEALPSIRGHEIAFVRRVPKRTRPALYVAPSRGAGRAKRIAGGSVPGVTAVKAMTLSGRGLLFVGLRADRGRRVQVLYRIWRGRRSVLERRSSTGVAEAGTIGAPHVSGDNVFYTMTLPAGDFRARTVLVRLNLRSGRRSLATPPAPFARRGGIASIVRFRHDFLLETSPDSNGNCFPAPANARCTLLRVSRRLAFRTRAR